MPKDLPILKLADATAWHHWLAKEGPTSQGVMLATIRKGADGVGTTLRYDQALNEALCFGWIDSGGRNVDDGIHLSRFGPRKANSLWSKRNVGYVERLEKENRIQPAGRAAIDAAKANGRWVSAYSGSGNTEMPPDFLAALEKVPAAKATWETLNKGNRWRVYFRLNNLRTAAGREKRIRTDVEMLARGEAPAPQKWTSKRTETKAREQEQVNENASLAVVNNHKTKSSGSASATRRTRTGRPMPSYAE